MAVVLGVLGKLGNLDRASTLLGDGGAHRRDCSRHSLKSEKETGVQKAVIYSILILLVGPAYAAPLGSFSYPNELKSSNELITQVRLVCNPSRCIDPRTGYYTQSTCDRYGCRQLGGVVGRTGPVYGREGGGCEGRGFRGGGFDCNASRCIDLSTGAIWESTCNYRGCRPLRPSPRYNR